jgi:predicted phage terminase large subunit-like protein
MAALQFVHIPGYAALILRRTYPDLALPGAIMSRAAEWLRGRAKWSDVDKTYTFPSGATLTFGYLQHEKDKYRYQSAEFQFIGFDELTQFSLTQYQYMFSRLRRLEGSGVPLRMRVASNPGGVGHLWVRQRFLIEGKAAGRVYVPAKIADNPYLDREQYLRKLRHLDPVTRERLMNGDWSVNEGGSKFRREWFQVVQHAPQPLRRVRYWDLAATEKAKGKDPSWTVGTLIGEHDGWYFVLDVARFRATPGEVERRISNIAQQDGRDVVIGMEQEPGSSGVNVIDHYRRSVLPGYTLLARRPTGSKEARANPFSSMCEAGNVKILEAPWNSEWLEELEAFPEGGHDDQVDSAVGAFEILTGAGRKDKPRLVVYHDPVSISPI